MSLLVSVIIPTYNRSAMIMRAIKSVIAQNYESIEIIVVDDASTDDTKTVVQAIQDNRIQYILRQERGGAAAARNTGIRSAKGEFIAFLDSDDEYLPRRLSAQVQMFETVDKNIGFVFGNYYEIGVNKSLRIPLEIKSGYVQAGRIFPASIFCNDPSVWMVRRSCFDTVGLFDEGLWTMEDLDMFARLVHNVPTYFIAEVLVHKYVHNCPDGRVQGQHMQQTSDRILRKWLPEMRRDKQFLVKFYSMMAKDMIRADKPLKAFYFFFKAWLSNPLDFEILGKMIKLSAGQYKNHRR